eukprot:7029040-Heterocapsa_arctica.AAC.1
MEKAQALLDDIKKHCVKLADDKVASAMKVMELTANGAKDKTSWLDGMTAHATFDELLAHYLTTLANEDSSTLTSAKNALTE